MKRALHELAAVTSLKRPRTLGGTGVINRAGKATNFHYYDLPGNTNMTYGGSAGLVGVIYAPSAALRLRRRRNATEVTGASVSRCVILDSSLNVHYDENLQRAGPFF